MKVFVVYDSLTGQVEKFAKSLSEEAIPINEVSFLPDGANIFLCTRSFNFGEVPESTTKFLNSRSKKKYHILGTAVSGNKNWGPLYGAAGRIIEDKCSIPNILTFEASGLISDVKKVKKFLNDYNNLDFNGLDILSRYKNGNTFVTLLKDGTKIRYTPDGEIPTSQFPENIDIKITNKCGSWIGKKKGISLCKFCHENSTPDGKVGSLNYKILDTLRKGTELAIGGGNVLESKELFLKILRKMKKQGVICSVTINQMHLAETEEIEFVNDLLKEELIYGLGISYKLNDLETVEKLMSYPLIKQRAVFHVINGVHSFESLKQLSKYAPKILILGFKDFRRGHAYLEKFDNIVKSRQQEIYENIHEILKLFKVVSFDNLAIEQLKLRRIFLQHEWEQFYMGDEATHTMYIDLVEGKFGGNSFNPERWDLNSYNSIDEIFKFIKAKYIK